MRAQKGFTLFILNEDMNNIIKIIKSLQDLGVLSDGVIEVVKHEMRWISRSFLNSFGCIVSAASNFFSSIRYKWKRI